MCRLRLVYSSGGSVMTFPIVKNPYNIKDSELGNGETQDDKEFNEQSIRLLKLSKGDRPYGLLWMQENELDLKVYHSAKRTT